MKCGIGHMVLKFPFKKQQPGFHIISHDGSMYGIYANIWGILMVNVTIYSIHGSVMGILKHIIPEKNTWHPLAVARTDFELHWKLSGARWGALVNFKIRMGYICRWKAASISYECNYHTNVFVWEWATPRISKDYHVFSWFESFEPGNLGYTPANRAKGQGSGPSFRGIGKTKVWQISRGLMADSDWILRRRVDLAARRITI